MWKYILNRLIQIVVTLFIFFAMTYFILDAQPGDITLQYMNNPRFTQEQRLACDGAVRPLGREHVDGKFG
jgi:ABC-type dipeptide/oligopeptide/nickel transport system permease component